MASLTPQQRNTAYQAFKRAMTSKRKPVPAIIGKEYEKVMGQSSLKPKMRMFEAFFQADGDLEKMQGCLKLEIMGEEETKESDGWLTRAQLAWLYHVKEDHPIVQAIIAKKIAAKLVRLHPEVPECEEAKLYFCMQEMFVMFLARNQPRFWFFLQPKVPKKFWLSLNIRNFPGSLKRGL